MEPFTCSTAVAVPMDQDNIDTDQISDHIITGIRPRHRQAHEYMAAHSIEVV